MSVGCRIRSSKHHHSPSSPSSASASAAAMLQATTICTEGDDDRLEFFPCPFCYVDLEVLVLCNHLREEHCFDVKNAVCPLCAGNVGKDMTGHFKLQHSNMLKRRKSWRANISTGNRTTVEKESEEYNSFIGVAPVGKKGNKPISAADPLLSPFICNFSFSDSKCNSKGYCETEAKVTSTSLHLQSLEPTERELEQDYEERALRAEFVQQVLLSTM